MTSNAVLESFSDKMLVNMTIGCTNETRVCVLSLNSQLPLCSLTLPLCSCLFQAWVFFVGCGLVDPTFKEIPLWLLKR